MIVLTKFSFWEEDDQALNSTSTKIWHEVLSRSATREATRTYQFISNNQLRFACCERENCHNVMTMVVVLHRNQVFHIGFL